MSVIKDVVKGDTINLSANLNTDITDWKIRCEIHDDCPHSIKLATTNSGGSTDQIEVTDASAGEFTIKVAKSLTTCFADKSFIEIEIENVAEEIHTVYQGEIWFKSEKIDWTAP